MTRVVNGLLAIRPLAVFAKQRARAMMIERAESIGVLWRKEVKALRSRQGDQEFSPAWDIELAQLQNPHLQYPDYYTTSFHAYDNGNLGWEPAMEVEVAAKAVHARIWQDAGAAGDERLRQSYHQRLGAEVKIPPQAILDIGCAVGLSTFALQALYPQAQVTGLDLSPYFLAIARYRSQNRPSDASVPTPEPMPTPNWIHAAAENTGLPSASFDLVSAHLVFHELPTSAAIAILHEAHRLLRPGGYLAIMDMNPYSEAFSKMPPYVFTLLKSTEPYLDQYFALDLEQAIANVGFTQPSVTFNTPRHRTLIAQVL